jgi:hypothetical protein
LRTRCLLALLVAPVLWAEEDFTVYDLLTPDSHKFAIVYDVVSSKENAPFYLNPIRKGAKVSDERVIDLATGKPLKFENVEGYLKVMFAQPVPKNGEARFRIYKTYEDAQSYFLKGDELVFDRPFGIRRNVILLPAGFELTGSTVPVMVSTQPDGRIRISMMNDRDDQLPSKITARRNP